MGVEIEYKFLVAGEPWTLYSDVKVCSIKQGYISKSKKHTVRIRTSNEKACITIKGPAHGLSRDEFEYSIPYKDALQLLKMCDGPLIEKTRYTFSDEHEQVWEVDVFDGLNAGLIVAELEVASEDTVIIQPSWVTKDVTYDRRYANSNLVSHPAPRE